MNAQNNRTRQSVMNVVLVVGMLVIGVLAGAGAAKVASWWDREPEVAESSEGVLTDEQVQMLATRAWFNGESSADQAKWCNRIDNTPRATLQSAWGKDTESLQFDNWFRAMRLICD